MTQEEAHNSITQIAFTQIAFTQIAHKRITQKAHKRNIPNNSRHTATLKRFYFTDRCLPQSVTQNPKERKKGSRDSLSLAGKSSPTTVSVVPPGPDSVRGRRTLSGTSCPDARVLCLTGAATSLDRASSGSAARQVDHSPPLSARLPCPSTTSNHSTTSPQSSRTKTKTTTLLR